MHSFHRFAPTWRLPPAFPSTLQVKEQKPLISDYPLKTSLFDDLDEKRRKVGSFGDRGTEMRARMRGVGVGNGLGWRGIQ